MTNLLKVRSTRPSKRLGRGYGSGKGGHTSSRGTKGQKARSRINVLFEGTKVKKSFIKRLPFRRGKGKFKASQKPLIVGIEALNLLPENSKVTVEELAKHGIVKLEDARTFGIKILGGGKLEKKMTVIVAISKSAAKIVEKAGGSVVQGEKAGK